jgi:serine/threonine protein kinase
LTTWNPAANELFLKILELDSPEERRACLDQACAGQPALRAQVEALLRASERAGRFLETPALALIDHCEGPGSNRDESAQSPARAAGPEPLPQGPGTLVGPYKLLQQIGKGGMGVVYLAEQQEPVRRQVALKVIKPGMDGQQVIARFEAERQALALMDHPHIARVFEAGTTAAGRPFFVMELVKGVPLTRYCDEARLSVRQRLELFVPVCRAVQHAHQKGVIHRDLKPSNLLVALYDGRPVPKVIDFGVAKATGPKLTERSVFTAFGTMVGTLEYMAPEQAELNQLDVDTRSDIYSLGVVLYELLTGTTPLERHRLREATLGEMLRLIQEEEPPKPSTRLSRSQTLPSVAAARQAESRRLCQLVQGELDWVVMKALAKERERRYETAEALAADLERHLRNEPVQAGPPRAGYRLRKWVRRHRGAVAAAAGMLALVVAGVVASTWQAVRATRAERAAVAALAAEQAARAQVRQALDTLTDDVVQTLLAKQPVLGEAEKAYLRKVLGYYEAFTQQEGDTPEARALQARGYFKVATLRQRLGERGEAEVAYRRSLVILEELAGEFPQTAAYRADLARGHSGLATLLEEFGRHADAETACRRAEAIYDKLAAEFATVPAYRRNLAASRNDLGVFLQGQLRFVEAEAAHRRALAVQEQLATEFPAVPGHRRDAACTHNNLGSLLQQLGNWAEAEAAYRRGMALHEQLVAEFPGVPAYRSALAANHNRLGELLRVQGRFTEAEAAHRQALAIEEALAGEFPAIPAYREAMAWSHHGLAGLFRDLGKLAEAEAARRQALALEEKLATEFPAVPQYRKRLVHNYDELARLLRDLGRHTEAESVLRQALAISDKLAVEFPAAPHYRKMQASFYNNLGGLLCERRRYAEAEAAHRQAVALQERLAAEFPAVPEYRRDIAASQTNLCNVLRELGKYAEAKAAYRQALTVFEKLTTEFPTVPHYRIELCVSLINFGDLLRDQQQPGDALAQYDRALAALEPLHEQEPRDLTTREFLHQAHAGRAEALGALQRYREALAAWDRALALSPPAARPKTQLARGQSRLAAGNVDEAVADAEAATQDPQASGSILYDAACIYSLAAATLNGDLQRRDAYAGRALALLYRAQRADFFKDRRRVDHVKQDADLKALQPRTDFQKLVQELEAAAVKP